MKKNAFPITIRNGNVRVKIYKTPTHGFDSFTVAYYFGGQRQRRTFADLATAKQEAQIAANKICAGELDVLTLTNSDRTAYVRSMELLKPFGTPLEMAVMQFTEAAKVLGGVSLLDAARFYAKHHNGKITSKRVPEIVTELLEAKVRDGLSEVYVRDLRTRLTRFAESFQCPLNMVLSAEIQDYLRGLPMGPRSKNNTRRTLQVLFHFAQGRGYLPKGPTEADDLPLAKEPPTPIGFFKPADMAKLLKHADADLVPFLAIGAFAGLRHAEILRLEWSEVDLAGGHIEVKAAKAKTASRRLVPITENLKLWLAPHRQEDGKVMTLSDGNLNLRLRALARSEAVQVQWPHNGLRHSFISYRVAKVQNVAQVALEAGNSPKIIFSNYRELVKPADAVKWFALAPETPANVIPAPLPAAAVA
ncbi:MAG: tyrosine-type recombinase/integrase [Verrucomicrobia bacterium]|nr:tyrosine-type recombinase/integrase [Verrucomicrobiota bacterium]